MCRISAEMERRPCAAARALGQAVPDAGGLYMHAGWPTSANGIRSRGVAFPEVHNPGRGCAPACRPAAWANSASRQAQLAYGT